jgi:isochorismate synthase EntC
MRTTHTTTLCTTTTGGTAGMNEDERVAAQQRDKLRADRKKDRERELRLENMKGNFKKQKMDRERDISEKIALGQLKVSNTVYYNMVSHLVYTYRCHAKSWHAA